MVELDILRKPFKDLKLAEADIPQQNFDKIASYIEKERMDEATEMIQAIFEEGNFDIRLISYYFYSDFLKDGVKSFIETFPLFMTLVKDHWEILRPFERKEKQVESSFNWFFTQIINKLKYQERMAKESKPSSWRLFTAQLSEQEFENLIEKMTNFSLFFHERWDKSPVKERMANLVKKVADLKPLLLDEKPLEETPVASEDPALEAQSTFDSPQTAELEEKAQQISLSYTSPFETTEMMNFLKKLKTFDTLVEKGELLKAAIVHLDITQSITHFDPCFYFPKLFSAYFNQLARHSSAISERSDNQESLEWKSLERLYKTDVDQFIEW